MLRFTEAEELAARASYVEVAPSAAGGIGTALATAIQTELANFDLTKPIAITSLRFQVHTAAVIIAGTSA